MKEATKGEAWTIIITFLLLGIGFTTFGFGYLFDPRYNMTPFFAVFGMLFMTFGLIGLTAIPNYYLDERKSEGEEQ